jgi:hypothetical protein
MSLLFNGEVWGMNVVWTLQCVFGRYSVCLEFTNVEAQLTGKHKQLIL